MADIESNIGINIDAAGAINTLKELQRQISVFQTTMAKSGAVSNAQLSNMQQNLVNGINATGQFTANIQRVKTTTESFTTALEKNKLSMGQYFRFAGSQVTGFRKLFSTEFDTIDKVARERVKTLQTQYIKLGRDASGAMQAIAVRPQVLDMQNLGTQTAIASQKAQLFNQLMKQGSTELLNFGKNTQWAGRQLMVGFTVPLGIMGAAAMKEFSAIEKQVIRLERVYGDFTTTVADTQKMTSQIKSLANEFTKYGVSIEKTIGLAADAAAMGKQGADLVAQVSEANRLAVLGGVDQKQSLEATISLTNAFGVSADKLSSKINFLNAVENQTVTSIEDLTTAIPTAGPVIQQLGGNVEDLTFFLTAMKEGGIDASEGANALKSGLASLINPSNEATTMLNGFGISLDNIVQANKGNVKGIVVDFAQALDTLDPLNRAQAIEQLFGKFQFSRLSTLFQNVIAEGSQASKVLDITKASATELALLSERELKRVESSPMFKFQKAIEQFKASLAPVGEEFMKAVTPIIEFGTKILEGFNSWSDGAKQFSILAVAAIGVVGPVLLMTFGLLANGLANIMKGFLAVRTGFKGLGGQSNVLTEQLNYMNSEQLEAAAVASSLNQVHNNLTQTFTSEAGAVRNLAAAYGQGIAAQNAFMGGTLAKGGARTAKKMATGGSVPGSGNGDTVPAMLTPGEFVLTKEVAARYPGTIAGMMSGTLQAFADGGFVRTQKSHTQSAIDKTNPEAFSASQTSMNLFSRLQQVIPEIADRIIVTGSMTADLTEKMNQQLRDSVGGIEPNRFEKGWNAREGKYTSTAVAGGLDPNSPEQRAALSEIEASIGKRAADLARAAGGTVTDTVLAKASDEILEEARTSKDKITQQVGGILNKRKNTAGDFRTNLADEEVRQLLKDKKAYQKGTMVYTSEGDIPIAGQRKTGMYKQSAKPISGGYTRQSDMSTVINKAAEEEFVTGKAASATKKAAKNIVENTENTLTEEIVASAKTNTQKPKRATAFQKVVSGEIGQEKYLHDVAQKAKNKALREGMSERDATRTYNRSKQEETTRIKNERLRQDQAKQAAAQKKIDEKKRRDHEQDIKDGVDTTPNLTRARQSKQTQKDIAAAQAKYGPKPTINVVPTKPLTPSLDGLYGNFKPGGIADKASKLVESGFNKLANSSAAGAKITDNFSQFVARKLGTEEEYLRQTGKLQDVSGKLTKKELAARQAANAATIEKYKEDQATLRSNKADARQKRAGRAMGAGMIATTAVGLASMMPGQIGEMAQQAMPVVSTLSMLAPILMALPAPIAIAVAAIGGIGFALYKMHESLVQARESATAMTEAVSSGTKSMQTLAEFAGTLSPSDIAAKQRAQARAPYEIVTGKNTFGGQYLSSETGANFAKQVQGLLKSGSQQLASDMIANQLSQAVSSEILSAEQAQSIVMNLGEKLQDYDLSLNISAKIEELIGPNGKKIKDNPIDVAVNLVAKSSESVSQAAEAVTEAAGKNSFFEIDWTDLAAKEATYAVAYASTVQQSQLSLDTIEKEHNVRIQNLRAANDLAGIQKENAAYEQNRNKLLEKNTEQLEAQRKELNDMGASANTNIASSATQTLKNMTDNAKKQFKDLDSKLKESAERSVENLGIDSGLSRGTSATLVAQIDIGNYEMFNRLEQMFPPDQNEQTYDYIAQISTTMGKGATEQLVGFITGMKDKDAAQKVVSYVVDLQTKNPKAAQEVLNAMNELTKVKNEFGKGVNLDLVINKDTGEFSEDVKKDFAEIDKIFEESGGKQVQYSASFLSDGFELTADQIAYFNSLPADQQKEYMSIFTTVTRSVDTTTDEGRKTLRNWSKGQRDYTIYAEDTNGDGLMLNTGTLDWDAMASDFAADQARRRTQAPPSRPLTSTGPLPKDTSGGGAQKEPTSFLDAIVKDIRDFTNATQRLTDNFKDSMDAIRAATQSAFGGLSQQLRGMGLGEDVIQLMTGMSKEDWDKYKDQFFNFDAAGNVTGFKDDLISIAEKMRGISLGKFVDEQQKTLANLRDQSAALTKLVSLGMSYADAYKAIENAVFAAAIANAKSAEEIRKIIDLANQARQAQDIASASASVANTNKATDATLAGLDAIIRFNGALTDTQTQAIFASQDLQTMLANFDSLSVDQLKVLNEALQDAANKEAIEIKIKMQTPEGMQELFNDGFNKAMEQFAAKEQVIKIKFAEEKKPLQSIIDEATKRIEDLKNAPGGLDDLEADIQRISEEETKVNDKYKERFAALDQISKINDRIAAQQRTQLSLADALSQGDIAAAARAAQEIRAQDAAQALVDQREALQKSQELEIEGIRANTGLSRKQLEEQIRNVKQQIFEIEEKSIEPNQYALDLITRREEAAVRELTVLGLSREQWEKTKAEVELARTGTVKYEEAIGRAKDLVQGVIDKWKNVPTEVTTIHKIIEKRIAEAEAAAAAAPPAALPATTPAPAAPQNRGQYRVKSGDTLWAIAQQYYGNGNLWTKIYDANRGVIGGNPNYILPGQVYTIPLAKGGLVPQYLAKGGFPSIGTDTVPAMLTPGEFVVKKYAVEKFGVDNLKAVNSGSYEGGSVYNYNMSVNVRSDANPNEIARTVIAQIKGVDAQRIRGNRF